MTVVENVPESVQQINVFVYAPEDLYLLSTDIHFYEYTSIQIANLCLRKINQNNER